jgi:hypothetical protein
MIRKARSGRFSRRDASEKRDVLAAVAIWLRQVDRVTMMNRGNEIRVGDPAAVGIGD